MKEWTLFLRKGVPFHFGYGEFTARDVVHSHALMLREEAVATFVGMWRNVEEVKVIDAYQVVFCMKGPATTLPYALSRRGDLRMVSKAQWDWVPWNDRRVRQAMNMAINRQEGAVGDPDTVAGELKKLADAGFDGFCFSFVAYTNGLPCLIQEVLPRLERLGLRQKQR